MNCWRCVSLVGQCSAPTCTVRACESLMYQSVLMLHFQGITWHSFQLSDLMLTHFHVSLTSLHLAPPMHQPACVCASFWNKDTLAQTLLQRTAGGETLKNSPVTFVDDGQLRIGTLQPIQGDIAWGDWVHFHSPVLVYFTTSCFLIVRSGEYQLVLGCFNKISPLNFSYIVKDIYFQRVLGRLKLQMFSDSPSPWRNNTFSVDDKPDCSRHLHTALELHAEHHERCCCSWCFENKRGSYLSDVFCFSRSSLSPASLWCRFCVGSTFTSSQAAAKHTTPAQGAQQNLNKQKDPSFPECMWSHRLACMCPGVGSFILRKAFICFC